MLRVLSVDTTMLPMHFFEVPDDDSGWTQTFRMSVAVLRTADILSTFWTGLYENSRHSRLTCRSIEDSAELLIFEFAFLT